MKIIYLLWHTRYIDEGEDSKLIGLYSSRKLAEEKILKYKEIEGFKDYPDGFSIASYSLDHDNWTEGFITTEPNDIEPKA